MMKIGKRFLFLTVIAAALIGPGLVFGQTGGTLTVSVHAGEGYSHRKWFGIMPVKLTPQIAVWLETEDGRYVRDLFVTMRSAKSEWRGGKDIRRPEALPVWSHRRGIQAADGLYMPDKGNPLPDAVTGATPADSFTSKTALPAGFALGRYRVFAEVNSSYDANNEHKNGVNGQPSAVYEAVIELSADRFEAQLSYAGFGEPEGKNGTLTRGRKGMTTALEIVKDIHAAWEP